MKKKSKPTPKKRVNPYDNFIMVPNEVMWSELLDHFDKIIFIALLHFNPSFPSQKKIAALTGIGSRNTVARSIKKMVDLGVIIRYKKGRGYLYYPKTIWSRDDHLVHRICTPHGHISKTCTPQAHICAPDVSTNYTKRTKLTSKSVAVQHHDYSSLDKDRDDDFDVPWEDDEKQS